MKVKLLRKTFISIMAMLMVAVTFVTTTYAWFKINSSANISGFDFEVTGGEGFLVSIDNSENSYTNNLSRKKILQSILLSYQKDKTASEKIFGYYVYEEGELYRANDKYDSEGNVEVVRGDMLSEEDMLKEVSSLIQLLPQTSADGIEMYDQFGAKSSVSKGAYLEFSVYFKAASNSVEENRAYDIYLNYEDKIQDDGSVIPGTSISSVPTKVKLAAEMTNNDGVLPRGTEITVYTSNAMRFSAHDVTSGNSIIYEYSNQSALEFGSYATDYDMAKWAAGDFNPYKTNYNICANLTDDQVKAREEYFNTLTEEEKLELDKLYNHSSNAMFTYYRNLKNFDVVGFEPLTFEDRLRSYRDLSKAPLITTVETGGDAKLVTFRFWIEGWDADCFDGLKDSVNVSLTFTSVKRKIDESLD